MRLFRGIFTLMHIGIVLLLAGTMLNQFITPQVFPWMNMLSLSFPFLLILHVAMCLMWILFWRKRAILFILATFLLYQPILGWLNYSPKDEPLADITVLTMNMKRGIFGKEESLNHIKDSGADVFLVQEYIWDLKDTNYPHFVSGYDIVAIGSKHRIIQQQKMATGANGEAIFADIDINGRIVRFINVYLNPFMFIKSKVKPADDYDTNKRKLRYIASTLVPTFKVHQTEIEAVRKAIENSPYPVIVTGDFNAVPNSYEYYQITDVLKDAFVEAGKGLSTSFHDYKFPIRIDYIFSSKEFEATSYKVDRSQKLSDHYPVKATFKFSKP